jgi:hypothetical protein
MKCSLTREKDEKRLGKSEKDASVQQAIWRNWGCEVIARNFAASFDRW